MLMFSADARAALRRWLLWSGLVMALSLTGCASVYIDGAVKEVAASEFKKPASPPAVQLFFEFQTKGVANARATELLKARVADQVRASGLFSAVGETPVPGGNTLAITINNVPVSDDAFSKGFVAGFTFGLVGQQVSDGYVCSARYRANASSEPVLKQARHVLHTTVGNASPPANATKAESIEQAVHLMARQVVSNLLNDLSRDAGFK